MTQERLRLRNWETEEKYDRAFYKQFCLYESVTGEVAISFQSISS
jgi:hypothetical protein